MEDVQALLERPKLYDNIDGSSELMLGCMLIGFAAFQWVGAHARQDSIWNKVYPLFIFVALLTTALIYGRKTMKSLFTYRRTGFVSYRKPSLGLLGLIGCIAAAVACGLAFLTVRRHEIDSTMLAMLGVGLVVTASYAYGIARLVRWKWVVAVLLMLGAVVVALLPAWLTSAPFSQTWFAAAFNPRFFGSLFLYLIFYALVLLLSGFVSLGIYLHETRLDGAETE
jgi:hypothetical protein